ncbi:MAG: hypothetical protein J6Y78_11010 [Paludibacteraceae bacterium]|nr:hypothetical protein [Paludibacteraceae bacterium]
MNVENELLIKVLKTYVMPKDYDLHNWEVIISRRRKYKDGVYIYPLAYADIYLTEELEFYDVETKQPNMKPLEG